MVTDTVSSASTGATRTPNGTDPPASTVSAVLLSISAGGSGAVLISTWAVAVCHQPLATYSFESQNPCELAGSAIVVELMPQR
jgi:hypothetical protein